MAQMMAGSLSLGEPAYATDQQALFVGNGLGKSLVGRVFMGSLADRADYDGVAGCMFHDVDTDKTYVNAGSWIEVAGQVRPVSMGGTGADTAAGARASLGLGATDAPAFAAVQVADPGVESPTAAHAGMIRYKETDVESRAEMVMRVCSGDYAWVPIMVIRWEI
jgi:hypothetical protein